MKYVGPFVTSFVITLLLSLGCNGGARHIATVSVLSADAVLGATQDTADALVCGVATAPPAPRCLTKDQRKAIASKLEPAFAADVALIRAVRAWPVGTPQPAEVAELVGQITALLNQVLALLPQTPQKDQLLVKIGAH